MRALELFSCSGGMALGFRRAGIEFTQAIDMDPDARASYEANLGHAPLARDVRECVRAAATRECWPAPRCAAEMWDLIVADPPCTPWSMAGNRKGLDDDRDCLAATVLLIGIVKPRCFLVANVPGLDNEPNRPVVQGTLGALWYAGYCVDYAKFDAADFGVPQHRVRPFWFGHPRGTPCIVWPVPTHGDPADLHTHALPGTELKPWRTCRDALGHLAPEDLGKPVHVRLDDIHHPPSEADEPAMVVRAGSGGGANRSLRLRQRADGSIREHMPDAPAHTIAASRASRETLLLNSRHPAAEEDAPAPTVGARQRGGQGAGILKLRVRGGTGSKQPRGHVASSPAQTVTSGFAVPLLSWPWDRPATTIYADPRITGPGHNNGSMLSQPNAVKLSEKAATILQGFPESWTFVGKTRKSRDSQRGQAMCPPLAEAVARSIKRWWDEQVKR